jgi:hypothetical protein
MLTRRLTMIALAAAFAASSSVALLQSARPAFAETDHNTRVAQNQRHDRDDWNCKHHKHTNPNGFWNNGRWHANQGHHNGQHKRHPNRDRDRH